MKLAIMQPYFFPYLGYFQLIQAVDKFVFYDDVNYMKSGWVNRNRYLHEGAPRYFTVPTDGASSFVRINAVGVNTRNLSWRRKLLETMRAAYRNAPFLDEGLRLFRQALDEPAGNIGEMARHSVELTLDYLGVKRDLVKSSSVYGNADLRGPDRVLDICGRENASAYVNAPGGRSLYGEGDFAARGCELLFLAPQFPEYDQGAKPFVPGLSVLDMVMRCPPDSVRGMLQAYRLERPESSAGLGSL